MRGSIRYLLVGIAATAIMADAQDGTRNKDGIPPNPSYNGRYAFARLRYTVPPGSECTCDVGGDGHTFGWQHDYPHAERNIMRIAKDLTSIDGRIDSSVVFNADDPELMKYPIVYLSEPACWNPSESEVKALRKYLLKGGLLIVDDFAICNGGPVKFARSIQIFEQQIHRVLPDGQLTEVRMADPTLNEFFKMDTIRLQFELRRGTAAGPPKITGIYEHNDPKKRLMVAANYNSVIHRAWVWQAKGLSSVDSKNEAYKLGVNYLMYGFTH